MEKFELTWSMFGTAEVEADTHEEAMDILGEELIVWTGTGTDLDEVQVNGVDVEP